MKELERELLVRATREHEYVVNLLKSSCVDCLKKIVVELNDSECNRGLDLVGVVETLCHENYAGFLSKFHKKTIVTELTNRLEYICDEMNVIMKIPSNKFSGELRCMQTEQRLIKRIIACLEVIE